MQRDFKKDFPRNITRRWRDAVKDDFDKRCPTVIVPTSASQEPATEPVDQSPVFRRYGTTLLTAILTPELLCVAQLGDGDMVWLHPNGEYERLLPGELAIGPETDSLCSSNAQMRWRTETFDRRSGGLLLLTTDGLPNSLADDAAFGKFVQSFRTRIADYGPAAVTDAAVLAVWVNC